MVSFDEPGFRRRVDAALKQVKTILDVNRNPRYPEDHPHTYDDKYALADSITNTTIAAQANLFDRMGLTEDKLVRLQKIVALDKRSVTVRFVAEDTCTFLKKQRVDVLMREGSIVVETSKPGLLGRAKKKSESSKHTVKTSLREYHWNIGVAYKIFCYSGNNPTDNPIVLQSRKCSTVVVTTGKKEAPFPERTLHSPVDLSLNWFLQHMRPNGVNGFVCEFEIDRSKESCRTPRRNDDIKEALEFVKECKRWTGQYAYHLHERVERSILGCHSPANPDPSPHSPSLWNTSDEDVFCPVVPLLEAGGAPNVRVGSQSLLVVGNPASASSPVLPGGDIGLFLDEQCRSLNGAIDALAKTFPPVNQDDKLITVAEAKLRLVAQCNDSLERAFADGINYIEHMLRKQLIGAIGKEVQPKDFDQFMSFHLKKLFAPQYSPDPFCFAIRRPDHFPEGLLTIERATGAHDDGGGGEEGKMEPIETMMRMILPDERNVPPISVALSAATTVQLSGPRYLHGWIKHSFSSCPEDRFILAARARQFSSFILIIGTMGGANSFVPKDAIVLRNKDEVLIPLLLTELPTSKEFKNAISSLSPAQRRFAESFRGMQLDSSVFGVCVVQIKPQLELLLGLPTDALTKEIRLTEDLMSLFVDYHVRADLLSFDGSEDASVRDKVDRVKEHVKSVMEVIDVAKQSQLEEATMIAEAARVQGEPKTLHSYYRVDDPMYRVAPPSALMWRSVSLHSLASSSSARNPSPASLELNSSPSSFEAYEPDSGAVERRLPDSFVATDVVNDASPRNRKKSESGSSQHKTKQAQPSPVRYEEVLSTERETIDFTAIPKQLDARFEIHDKDNSLRSTILTTKETWSLKRQQNLLSKPQTTALEASDIRSEQNKAFDLLDALSRSGSLPISCSELHVVVAVTHRFERDVMGTVIEDNVNPIEKVEKSCLLIGSTIQETGVASLLADSRASARLEGTFPALFEASANPDSVPAP